jgi:hypothetical protein
MAEVIRKGSAAEDVLADVTATLRNAREGRHMEGAPPRRSIGAVERLAELVTTRLDAGQTALAPLKAKLDDKVSEAHAKSVRETGRSATGRARRRPGGYVAASSAASASRASASERATFDTHATFSSPSMPWCHRASWGSQPRAPSGSSTTRTREFWNACATDSTSAARSV